MPTKCNQRQRQPHYCLLRHRLHLVAIDFQIQSASKSNLASAMQKKTKIIYDNFVKNQDHIPLEFQAMSEEQILARRIYDCMDFESSGH